MNLVSFILGLLPPAILGWLLIRVLEGKTPVLGRIERIAMAIVTGITVSMFLVFCAHVFGGARLSLLHMFAVQLIAILVLAGVWLVRRPGGLPVAFSAAGNMPFWTKIVFILLGLWMATKIIVTAATFLLLTPTYLDDTLDNWNLRAKVFYFDEALTLVLPNEDPAISPLGVSSYPPTVPLLKAWLAHIGGWNDALINSIHVVWYLAALVLLYFALRRLTTVLWSLTGTYILGSIPLYLMHGVNTYADAFLSVHVFIAVSLTFFALREEDDARQMSFVRLAALATGLLAFTKNEGMLLYLSTLLFLLIVALAWKTMKKTLTLKKVTTILLWFIACVALVALPWLIFKWTNGLTFGNAKPFTSLGLAWQEGVLLSIGINTFFEGNWLLLFPLLFGLIIIRWRSAFGNLWLLTAFFLILYIGQMFLYMFTGLSTEAIRQTGYARGLIHLMPVIVFLTTLLLKETANKWKMVN